MTTRIAATIRLARSSSSTPSPPFGSRSGGRPPDRRSPVAGLSGYRRPPGPYRGSRGSSRDCPASSTYSTMRLEEGLVHRVRHEVRAVEPEQLARWRGSRPTSCEVSSGYASSGTFLLAEMKPPRSTQICWASGVSRYWISDCACGVSLNIPNRSPPPVTLPAKAGSMSGNGEEVVLGRRPLRPRS